MKAMKAMKSARKAGRPLTKSQLADAVGEASGLSRAETTRVGWIDAGKVLWSPLTQWCGFVELITVRPPIGQHMKTNRYPNGTKFCTGEVQLRKICSV